MSSPAELFRTNAMVKEIDELFSDIRNGVRDKALTRATVIGMKLGGDDRHRLMDSVYAELKKAPR
jgi:DNA-binding transcriptional regulator YbjK